VCSIKRGGSNREGDAEASAAPTSGARIVSADAMTLAAKVAWEKVGGYTQLMANGW